MSIGEDAIDYWFGVHSSGCRSCLFGSRLQAFEQTFGLLKIHLGRRKGHDLGAGSAGGAGECDIPYQALGDRIELIPAGLIDEADYRGFEPPEEDRPASRSGHMGFRGRVIPEKCIAAARRFT